MGTLNKQSIKKGSALNLWAEIGDTWKCIAWSTSHTFQSTTNMNEVNVKEAGDYPLQMAQNITWNIQCEYLYSTENNVGTLLALHKAKTPVKITFCEVSGYSETDEQGIIGSTLPSNKWSTGNVIAYGNVIINDLTINSAAGENASVSCTLTGDGSYDSSWTLNVSGAVIGPTIPTGAASGVAYNTIIQNTTPQG